MRIYRWKKPKLDITVTAGGTLAASTTYYMKAFFRSGIGNTLYFWGGAGPASDTYDFTTTATDKSISVAWYTDGDITAYSDAGGGEVNVHSDKHCLNTGDEVTIQSGTYAGTYTITWVDYDTFKITATWSATDTSTWKCEDLPNGALYLIFYMHTIDPDNADGTFNRIPGTTSQYMSHYNGNDGYTSNPVVVDAPYTPVRLGYDNMFFATYIFDKSYVEFFKYGFPAMTGSESSITSQDLQDEAEAAGLFPLWRFSDYSWYYWGAIEFTNWEDTFEDLAIYCEYGGFKCRKLTLEESTFQVGKSVIRDYVQFIAKNSYLGCGDKVQFDGYFTDNSTDDYNLKNINVAYYPESHLVNPTNQKVMNGGLMNTSYPKRGTLTNSEFYNGRLYVVYSSGNDYPAEGFRNFRNLSIKSNQSDEDFRIYTYSSGNYTQVLENIDTDRANNLKTVMLIVAGVEIDYVFMRKGTFYLEDDLDGATVTINAGSDTYNYTSVSGEVDFDIVEQYSYPRRVGSSYNFDDNIVEDFQLTISKEGYGTLNMTIPLAQDFDGAYFKLPASGTQTKIYDSTLYDSTIY